MDRSGNANTAAGGDASAGSVERCATYSTREHFVAPGRDDASRPRVAARLYCPWSHAMRSTSPAASRRVAGATLALALLPLGLALAAAAAPAAPSPPSAISPNVAPRDAAARPAVHRVFVARLDTIIHPV